MELVLGYLLAGLAGLGALAYWAAGKLAAYQVRQLERILERYTERSSSSGLDIVRIGDSTHIIGFRRVWPMWCGRNSDAIQE